MAYYHRYMTMTETPSEPMNLTSLEVLCELRNLLDETEDGLSFYQDFPHDEDVTLSQALDKAREYAEHLRSKIAPEEACVQQRNTRVFVTPQINLPPII